MGAWLRFLASGDRFAGSTRTQLLNSAPVFVRGGSDRSCCDCCSDSPVAVWLRAKPACCGSIPARCDGCHSINGSTLGLEKTDFYALWTQFQPSWPLVSFERLTAIPSFIATPFSHVIGSRHSGVNFNLFWQKFFFRCDRILFRIFHSFLTFTLEEPFLSRRKYFSTGLLLIPYSCFWFWASLFPGLTFFHNRHFWRNPLFSW